MADSGLAQAASTALLERKEELAHAVTEALYRERPELLERWGAEGRAHCLQDMRYNLEHLAPAVALGEPALFERYVGWLRDMLGARGIPARDVADSLRLTRTVALERMPAAQAALIARALDAGLDVL